MAKSVSFLTTRRRSEEHWIPLSDLMTGLMMIFMLISVISIAQVEASRNAMRRVAQEYGQSREAVYAAMVREFSPDLARWRAHLDPDLTVRFDQPDVLFATGQSALRDNFKRILSDFFPRYVRILSDPRFAASITEIRVEGHTSSGWNGVAGADEAYFRNMELSQSRTRSVLAYVLLLPELAGKKAWLTRKLTANGLSSSQPVLNPDGTENPEASQRVAFKIRTNAEAQIRQIVETGGGSSSALPQR